MRPLAAMLVLYLCRLSRAASSLSEPPQSTLLGEKLVGEDNFTLEIPVFASAICGLAAPGGLAGMALEVSPEAAAFAESTLGQPDRWAQMAL
jgi:hypothetical protein